MKATAGRWKEGRMGGASLCYVRIRSDQLTWVAEHHAAVGIRATVACDEILSDLPLLAGRNWDLVLVFPGKSGAVPGMAAALQKIDGHSRRGILQEVADRHPSFSPAYLIGMDSGALEPPGSATPDPLPSMEAAGAAPMLQKKIDAVVRQERYAIWRLDAVALDQLGLGGHQQLMQWLGDHHARIWCAPVRDIVGWRDAQEV